MKKLIKLIIIAVIAGYGTAIAQDRDPFLPYTWSSPNNADTGAGGTKSSDSANPLVDKPVSAYTVIGVVISPTDALAVLKSRDKREYFAYIGDAIGSEGGIIETINTDGITVNISGKIVPLKVSNRFEMQDEKQTEKQ